MKKINLGLSTILGLLLMGFSADAQTYLCSGKNIKFQVATATLNAGDNITWYWDEEGTEPITAGTGVTFETVDGVTNAVIKFNAESGATAFTAPASTVTEKAIYAKVTSGAEGACSADNIEDFAVTILPILSIDVTDVTTTYCANATSTGSITATVPTITGLPSAVTVDFAWNLDGTPVTSSIETTGLNSVLTYTTSSTAGTYEYQASVTYNIGSGTFVGGACSAATDATSIIVAPAPSTPTITVDTF